MNQMTSISPWNHQKDHKLFVCQGGTEINKFSQIRLILQPKLGDHPQPAITCSKLAIETLEQDVNYVQS